MQYFRAKVCVDSVGYEWVDRNGRPIGDEWPQYDSERESVALACKTQDLEKIRTMRPGIDLASNPRVAKRLKLRSYDPFIDEPGLFIKFAFLGGRGMPGVITFDTDQILDFANAYGTLNRLPGVEGWEAHRETLGLWQASIRLIHYFLDAASVGPQQHTEPAAAKGGSQKTDSNLRKLFEQLLSGINCGLEVVEGKGGSLSFANIATDLWTVIRLQCAIALSESRRFSECPTCKQPFELSPKLGRSDKVFCTPNCRVKWYQRKITRAKRLRAEGNTVKQIADELESDVKTVKGWLSK